MQPRLRRTVTYLPTNTGMLFRNGDTFLPINGKGAWDAYQSVKPLLESIRLTEQVRRKLLTILQGPLAKFYEALKSSDMLYEATDEDLESISDPILTRFDRECSRIELKSNSPLRAFAQISTRRVLIIGDSDTTVAVAEAAIESGLRHLILLCPDSAVTYQYLQPVVERERTEGDAPVIEVTTSESLRRQTLSWDELLVVQKLDGDWGVFNELIRPILANSDKSGCAIYLGRSSIAIGVCDANAGCDACIQQALSEDRSLTDARKVIGAKGSLVIGARILLRHFWNVQLEGQESISRQTMVEFNLGTREIRRRPRPVCKTCQQRRVAFSNSLELLYPPSSVHETAISKVEFCERADTVCVDKVTGIVRILEEGDLLQYPSHMCVARLEDCDGDVFSPWLEECGGDLFDARVGTVRRALERHYYRQFRLLHSEHQPNQYYDSSGEQKRSTCCPTFFADGIVVSGGAWCELIEQSFFQALAKHAHARRDWVKSRRSLDLQADQEVNLFSEHLKDIGAMDSISVCEPMASPSDWVVLRFHYRGQPISVVAGQDLLLAWRIGLQDIWMHITSCDIRRTDECFKRSAIKFRAAPKPTSHRSLWDQVSDSERGLGMRLCLFPIATEEWTKLLSLSFVYACFTQCHPNDLRDQFRGTVSVASPEKE